MSACPQDESLVDLVYGEVSEDERAELERHVEVCERCGTELARLGGTAAAFSRLPDAEPPAAVRESLLRAAAQANHVTAASPREPAPPLPGRLRHLIDSWLRPAMQHPALAAAASLVVILGIAGALRWQGGDMAVEQIAQPTAPPAADRAAEPEPETAAGALDEVAGEQAADEAAAAELAEEADLADEPVARERLQAQRRSEAQERARRDKRAAQAKAEAFESQPAARGAAERRAPDPGALGGAATSGAETEAGRANQKRAARPEEPADDGAGAPARERQAAPEGRFAEPPRPASRAPAQRQRRARAQEEAAPREDSEADAEADAPAAAEAAPESDSADADDGADDGASAREVFRRETTRRLAAAARAKRCRDAAVLANDLRDREPRYYRERIHGAEILAPCREAIEAERRRRAE